MTTPQEIWSVRLQREIIALTTPAGENATASSAPIEPKAPADNEKGEDMESKTSAPAETSTGNDGKNANSTIGELPPFVSVEKHNMDIEKGICQVWFEIEVNSKVKTDVEEETEKDSDCVVGAQEEPPSPPPADEPASTPAESQPTEADGDNIEPSSEIKNENPSVEKSASTEETIETSPSNTSQFNPIVVTIILDASLPQAHKNTDMVTCYPFSKPFATFASGEVHLPTGSTLKDGDKIIIDCDWTPSLHLRDAAVNIALKLREGIKRKEPIHKDVEDEDELRMIGEALSQGVSQGTQKMKSFFLSVKEKAAAVADDLDKAVTAERAEKEEKLRRQQERKQNILKKNRLMAGRKKMNSSGDNKKVVDGSNVEIGDSINLAMHPWSEAIGMHACKAIRRPDFIETAIKLAASDGGDNMKDVAGSGISATGSIFQSFRQSAKSLVEESYLMITPDHILEVKCSKFSVATATVTYVVPVSSLAKLKFRRRESISLFFRQSPDDPAIYMCDTSAEAVKVLQGALKKYGVKGKHTNATMQRCIKSAIVMIDEIQAREIELEEAGEFENRRAMVGKIMNLYRQAAEQFELAGDPRHKEVMTHMHEFLAKPLVVRILDNKSNSFQEVDASVPEGEILDSLDTDKDKNSEEKDLTNTGEDDDEHQESDDFNQAMEAAESMLKDAHDDLKDLGIEEDMHGSDDIDTFGLSNSDELITGDNDNDVVTEFEDMLKDADKELAELMGS